MEVLRNHKFKIVFFSCNISLTPDEYKYFIELFPCLNGFIKLRSFPTSVSMSCYYSAKEEYRIDDITIGFDNEEELNKVILNLVNFGMVVIKSLDIDDEFLLGEYGVYSNEYFEI